MRRQENEKSDDGDDDEVLSINTAGLKDMDRCEFFDCLQGAVGPQDSSSSD